MNVWDRIFRRSAAADYQGATLLDHLPLSQRDDWRRQRLLEAAEKYGKPFKCAGPEVPYERLTPHRIERPEPAPLRPAASQRVKRSRLWRSAPDGVL